jgi:thiol-disulfide isomerase/thioredoxin
MGMFDLNNYKGKFVLIDFWGTWCAPCIALIPELKKLYEKYRHKNLYMVSIACEDESVEAVKKAIKKFKMNWINIWESLKKGPFISDTFRINSFPTTLLINSEGKIIFRGGTSDFDFLKQLLEKNLK